MDPIARAAKIKSELFQAGYSLNAVDRKYGLPRNSVSKALRQPNEAAEHAIANALGRSAHELFPERYDLSGHRLEPQPPENYERLPTMAQRQKQSVA